MVNKVKRTPIMVPLPVYRKFIKKKGYFVSQHGKNISNHKFLEMLLERVTVQ
jgi:hypothetical protein